MKKILLVLLALGIITAGCSDDSGSSNTNPEYYNLFITGKVSDPAVEGAVLELYGSSGKLLTNCGVNGNTVCRVWSKKDGTFKFAQPINTDVSLYTIKTSGGIDTAYGYEIEYPLTRQIKNTQGRIDMFVSPVTSLVYEVKELLKNESNAEKTVAKSLGITVNELYGDPESNVKLLKASYIINNLITFDNTDAVRNIKDIAVAIKNGESLEADNTLQVLIKEPDKLKEAKAMVSSINTITSKNTKPESAVKEIKVQEKQRMVSSSIMALTSTSALSENAKTNIKNLISDLDKIIGKSGIPLDTFIVEQLVKYIGSLNNKKLSQYSAYDVTPDQFNKTWQEVTASAGKEVFNKEIKMLASEKVSNINVALDSPLGMDNQARLNYYFNSTKDINYKARQLTKIVLDDRINESIYSTIIKNYASYGFLDKAERFANIQIKGTLDRISELGGITYEASKLYLNKNMQEVRQYADKAYELIKNFDGTKPDISSNYIAVYTSLLHSFASIRDTNKIIEVKTDIFKKLEQYPIKPSGKEPARYTLYSRVYNGLGNMDKSSALYKIIEDGNLKDAYTLLLMRKEAIDYAKTITTYPHHNGELIGYQAQLAMIMDFYHKDEKKEYTDKLKAMVTDIKQQIFSIRDKMATNPAEFSKYYYLLTYPYLADAVNYILGDESGAVALYNEMNPSVIKMESLRESVEKAKKDTAGSIFRGNTFKKGFQNSIKSFEERVVLEPNKANLITDYLDRIVGIGGNAENHGFVYAALKYNKKKEAKAALDYMYNKINELILEIEKGTAFPAELTTQLISYSISNSTDLQAKYNISGVTALAKAYIEAGYEKEAINSLKLADKYLATLVDSIGKQDYNMALAYMAKEAGDMALAKKYFDAGIQVGEPAGATTAQKAYLYLLKAADANYLRLDDKNHSTAKTNLAKAEQLIASISAADFSTEKDPSQTAIETQTLYYSLAAVEYYNAAMIDKAKSLLLKAENTINGINSPTVKKSMYERLIKSYGSCELIDEGYDKIISLTKNDITNRNAFITLLVDMVSKKNDFETTGLATVDTDKDGKPDFFYPWVTEKDMKKEKLTIDEDIDGDNIDDNSDVLPYIKEN